MRFLKRSLSETFQDVVERIAGEMINIQTGRTWFINGIFQNSANPEHNAYQIGNVNYEIHPNMGVVIICSLVVHSNVNEIINAYNRKYAKLPQHLVQTPVGHAGTTQYITVAPKLAKTNDTKFKINMALSPVRVENSEFIWHIYTRCLKSDIYSLFNNATPLYIPDVDLPQTPLIMYLSLSMIIVDDLCDIWDLKDNYLSPNVPEITDYTIYKNNLFCPRRILFDPVTIIDREIAHWFCDFVPSVQYYSWGQKVTINRFDEFGKKNIFWLKWENIQYHENPDYTVDWENYIMSGDVYKRCQLIKTKNDGDLTDDDNPRCFISGIPIYEDCYVFDIYQHQIKTEVDEKDLPDELANGAILDDGSLFEVSEKKTTHTKNVKLIKKSTSRRPRKKGEKLKMMTKIIKTIIHDVPCRILISPITMHFHNKNAPHPLNPLVSFNGIFELMTNSKIIIYRTFCPRTASQVIQKLDYEIGNYKNILLAMHHKCTFRDNLVESTYNNKKYTLKRYGAHDSMFKNDENFIFGLCNFR